MLFFNMRNKTNLHHNITCGILTMKRKGISCSMGILGRHQCPEMVFNTLKGYLISIWRKAAHASRLLICCVVHFMGVVRIKVCVHKGSSSGVVVRSTGAYKRLIGHPAGPVLGWVARVECPVPKHYTCQAVRSGFRESFSWLSIVVRMRRKIEVPPT